MTRMLAGALILFAFSLVLQAAESDQKLQNGKTLFGWGSINRTELISKPMLINVCDGIFLEESLRIGKEFESHGREYIKKCKEFIDAGSRALQKAAIEGCGLYPDENGLLLPPLLVDCLKIANGVVLTESQLNQCDKTWFYNRGKLDHMIRHEKQLCYGRLYLYGKAKKIADDSANATLSEMTCESELSKAMSLIAELRPPNVLSQSQLKSISELELFFSDRLSKGTFTDAK